jgi:hypothetical protein
MIAITEFNNVVTTWQPDHKKYTGPWYEEAPTWEYALRYDGPDSDTLIIQQNTIERTPRNWFLIR